MALVGLSSVSSIHDQLAEHARATLYERTLANLAKLSGRYLAFDISQDHTDGIEAMSVDVYCTDLTRRLLLLRCPGAQQAGPHNAGQGNRFHTLELGVRTKVCNAYRCTRLSRTSMPCLCEPPASAHRHLRRSCPASDPHGPDPHRHTAPAPPSVLPCPHSPPVNARCRTAARLST